MAAWPESSSDRHAQKAHIDEPLRIYVSVYTLRVAKRRKSRRGPAVGEPPPPPYAHSPAIARVFQSGNSQAVRLPKQFRLRSKQVQVFRRGNDLVLRERPAKLSQL